MTAQRSRLFRYSMFGMLYFVQGVGLAYYHNFQKPYLNSFHIDADVIGLLASILLLPFILKIFIGMLSDRVNLFGLGHRKPYMAMGLVLAAVCFSAASLFSPGENLTLFAVSVLLGSFSVTLFDSTADGMAIDTTPEHEQGTVQGIMTGSRAVAFIILSLLFGYIVESFGFRPVFLIIAASMLLPLIWVLRVEEPPARSQERAFSWAAFKVLGQPLFLIFALYAIVYSIVSFGADGLVTFYLSQRFNAPERVIGTYGALRGLGAVLGALGGGLLVDRLGRARSAYLAALLVMLGVALLGLMPSMQALVGIGIAWGVAWGFQETVFFALAMRIADTRIAASMFALMMAVSNIGSAIGEGVATGLTDDIGFVTVFLGLAAFNLVVFPVLWALTRFLPASALARAAAPAER